MNHEPRVMLFDMDGVLVDVSRSFRTIIRELVREYTGSPATAADVQALKERGGFNDDIRLSRELIRRGGRDVTFQEVKARFDEMYQGTDQSPGMYKQERWLVDEELLARLAGRYRLGVVTGRTQREVSCARRLPGASLEHFGVVVTQDEVSAEQLKPRPDTLLLAMQRLGVREGFYVGDSVDDQTAALAAGLEPIGVIPPGASDPGRLRRRLIECGASTVLDSIDEIRRWA